MPKRAGFTAVSGMLSALLLVGPTGCSSEPGADGVIQPPNNGTGADPSTNRTAGGNSMGGGSTNAGTNGNGGSDTKAGGMTVTPSTDACPSTALPRTPLRRLTRFEYKNTAADLLGVDPSAADDLPADETTNGFDNNASVLTVSSLHTEKHVLVSEALARAAVQNNLAALTDCDPATAGDEACARDFARRFGRRAFRRPVTPEDEQLLMAAYTAGSSQGSFAEGIEVMIRAALQSPHFLYRLETTTPADEVAELVPLTQFELATRLSYLTWASAPDDALLDAAERGELATREQVAAKARDMLGSPKAIRAFSNFYTQWAGTKRLPITSKDATLFPLYSNEVNAAMAAELPAFVEHVLYQADGKLSTLLTAPVAFVTTPLAEVYGVAAPAGAELSPQLVNLPPEQGRSGLLTQAGFLAVQAHPDQTSPVLRGKFVRAMLLCEPVPPPPDDVNISVPEVDPNATARERFSAHMNSSNSCYGCHQLMDPIGFTFENFDALGQYRETDNGQPLDVSGEIIAATEPSLAGPYSGVQELGQKLAGSEHVQNCLATQWLRFAAGRLETNLDACSLGTLQELFRASDGDLLELAVATTQIDAFWYRSVSQ